MPWGIVVLPQEKVKFLQMLDFAHDRGWIADKLRADVVNALEQPERNENLIDLLRQIRTTIGEAINRDGGLPSDCDDEIILEVISYGTIVKIMDFLASPRGSKIGGEAIFDDIIRIGHLFRVVNNAYNVIEPPDGDFLSDYLRKLFPKRLWGYLDILDNIDSIQLIYVERNPDLWDTGVMPAYQENNKTLEKLLMLYHNLVREPPALFITIDRVTELVCEETIKKNVKPVNDSQIKAKTKKYLQRNLPSESRITVCPNTKEISWYPLRTVAKVLAAYCIRLTKKENKKISKEATIPLYSESEWTSVIKTECKTISALKAMYKNVIPDQCSRDKK